MTPAIGLSLGNHPPIFLICKTGCVLPEHGGGPELNRHWQILFSKPQFPHQVNERLCLQPPYILPAPVACQNLSSTQSWTLLISLLLCLSQHSVMCKMNKLENTDGAFICVGLNSFQSAFAPAHYLSGVLHCPARLEAGSPVIVLQVFR